jgi:hypothetical protein
MVIVLLEPLATQNFKAPAQIQRGSYGAIGKQPKPTTANQKSVLMNRQVLRD